MTQAALFPAEQVAITEAAQAEFHPTPLDVVAALFQGMREAGHEPLPLHGCVRESAAGEGALVRAIDQLCPSESRIWYFFELRRSAFYRLPTLNRAYNVDFLAVPPERLDRVDLDITNPPWSRALEWAEVSLQSAEHVALHVPLATVETPERVAFLRRYPCDLYPLEWRPNYDGRGGVQRAVCWLVWGPGRGGRWFPLKRHSTPVIPVVR